MSENGISLSMRRVSKSKFEKWRSITCPHFSHIFDYKHFLQIQEFQHRMDPQIPLDLDLDLDLHV